MPRGDEPIRFEMDRLVSCDDNSLIEELRRVVAMVTSPVLTRVEYDRHALASSDTVCRRFGGWSGALERAGLGDRYGGPAISQRMREQPGRTASAEDVVAELQRIASAVGRTTITRADLTRHGVLSERTVLGRFGTWKAALAAAGLQL